MIIIHTALYPEAKQLVSHFKLKRDLDFPIFELYHNDQFAIIVSGIGKLNTAIGLTSAILHLRHLGINLKEAYLINFGLAGGTENLTIGQLYYIQKITDHATESNFYPDLIFKINLSKTELTTFDRPVHLAQFPELKDTLVDMEASGFFQTANKFVDVHQIHCLKILIDHLKPQDFKFDYLSELVNNNFHLLLDFIDSLPWTPIKENLSPHELAEHQEIERITKDLKLSKSQAQQLNELVTQYQILTKLLFEDFIRTYHYKISDHKSINSNTFEKLKAKLLIEIGKHVRN